MNEQIVFLGPDGSYSSQAAKIYAERSGVTLRSLPKTPFSEVLSAFEKGDVGYAILPIENSTEGAVTPIADYLAWSMQSGYICGEVVLPIHHALLGSGDFSQIRKVFSHPQALMQCSRLLDSMGVERVAVDSTSQGVEMVTRNKDPSQAAIASESSSGALGVIRKCIQDNPQNETRFVIVSHAKPNMTLDYPKWKTSVVFTLEKGPGSLSRALTPLTQRNISMSHISSRPAKESVGNYIFCVDVEGKADNLDVEQALRDLQRQSVWYKYLGSYPVL